MTLDLLPKPKRSLIFGKWILIKGCSCYTCCKGHILLLTSFYNNSKKIDIYQWNKVIEQELSAYEERINPSTEEGMSTEALVQEIDQDYPEEVSNDNKSSPKKKKKPYTGRKKPCPYVKIFGK
jgi:hypothetical protein